MKAELHTSPIAAAFLSQEECPFCHLEAEAEKRAIRFFAGASASYMEPSIRGLTNRLGFCSGHMKKLHDYGNVLGNALMLHSHMEEILLELDAVTLPEEKKGLFKKKSKDSSPVWQRLQQRIDSCAICNQLEESVQRHYQTFFSLLAEPEFRGYVENCKGFCLGHFVRLLQEADQSLPQQYAAWFYPTVHRVMKENMVRVHNDMELFIQKHDYRNAALDWGNAKDSVPRAMRKLAGINPTEAPYKKE